MCVLRALLRRPAIVLRMFARLKSTHDKVCHWKCFQAKAVPVTGYKGAATIWLCFLHFSDFANPEFSHLSYHALVPVSPLLVNSHYKAVCASQQKYQEQKKSYTHVLPSTPLCQPKPHHTWSWVLNPVWPSEGEGADVLHVNRRAKLRLWVLF